MGALLGMTFNKRTRITTRQTTCYHIGDGGDQRKAIDASYTQYNVLTAGQYAGTVNIDLPHYAAATISFDAATKKILNSANGLAIFKTGDTLVVKGTAGNSGVLTVATGNVAGEIVTTEALTDEAAGAYMTICKRVTHSNNCVQLPDSPGGKMYARYAATGLIGDASNAKLNWYDAAKCFTLHPAAADLQMVAGGTLRIVGGAGEVARYFAGEIVVFSGFANAVNNLPGYRVTAVTVNGADLDLTLWTGNMTVVAEAAGGSRAIKVVCSSVFGYVAAANVAQLGGYSDWCIPNDLELKALCDMEQPTATPDAVAFPSWPTSDYFWSATTLPNITSYAMFVHFYSGIVYYYSKTSAYFCGLVRG